MYGAVTWMHRRRGYAAATRLSPNRGSLRAAGQSAHGMLPGMFGSLWRFLVYRVMGGRVLLGITVLGWLYNKLTGRRPAVTQTQDRRALGDRP